MTAYTIVNLAWRESEPGFWQADSVFGDLAVGEFGRRVRVWVDGKEIRAIAGGTLEDGKAKAEKYYRERLLSALVPVSPMEGRVIVDPVFPAEPEASPRPARRKGRR